MKLKKAFVGVKDSEIYPTEFAAGDECPPELEAAALELGALDAKPATKKQTDPAQGAAPAAQGAAPSV